jgi:hypothetical protein
MRDFPTRGGLLVATDGSTLPITDKAAKALQDAARNNKLHIPQAGDRYPAPLDGGPDPDPAPGPQALQVWYGDPAKHPNAYIAVTFETAGEVIVRDGEDPTGKALHFTIEQWASYTDPEWTDPDENEDGTPAEVTDPDQLSKLKPRSDSKAKHPERA